MDPALLSGIGHLAGGLSTALGGVFGSRDARASNRQAQYNYENAVQIRVRDAKKAGIHPLAALGMPAQNPTSFAFPGRASSTAVKGLGEAFQELGLMAQERQLAQADQEIRKTKAEADIAESKARITRMQDQSAIDAARVQNSRLRDLWQQDRDSRPARALQQFVTPGGRQFWAPSEELAQALEADATGIAAAIGLNQTGSENTLDWLMRQNRKVPSITDVWSNSPLGTGWYIRRLRELLGD